MTTSPLQTTTSKSLDELFATDPENLTKEDVGIICAKLREARKQFAIAEEQGKKPKATTPLGKDLALEDIGL